MFELSWIMLHAFLAYLQWSPDIDLLFDNEIAWTETNEKLAIATSYGLWVYDFDNDVVRLLSDCEVISFNPEFKEDGNFLSYSTTGGYVHIVDIKKQTTTELKAYGENIFQLLFGLNGSQIIVASGIINPLTYGILDSKIEVWDYQTNEILRTMDLETRVVTDMQINAETNVLWVTGTVFGLDIRQSYLWAVDMRSGSIIVNLPLQLADVAGVRMDNAMFIYSTTNATLNDHSFLIWDIRKTENRIIERNYDQSLYSFNITDVGERIAMITRNGHVRIRPFYGSQDHQYELDIQRPSARSVHFDPNGERLAIQLSGDLPEVEIWDMESMTQTMTLRTADWYQADCGE